MAGVGSRCRDKDTFNQISVTKFPEKLSGFSFVAGDAEQRSGVEFIMRGKFFAQCFREIGASLKRNGTVVKNPFLDLFCAPARDSPVCELLSECLGRLSKNGIGLVHKNR